MGSLFTIGCSTLTIKEFIKLLKDNNITAVADVRSVPYSKFTPQFNVEILSVELEKNNIHYLSFSKEFGAGRDNNSEYTNQKVDFLKVINSNAFDDGICRIKKGLIKEKETPVVENILTLQSEKVEYK